MNMLAYIKNFFGFGKAAEVVVQKDNVVADKKVGENNARTIAEATRRTPEQKKEQYRRAYTPLENNPVWDVDNFKLVYNKPAPYKAPREKAYSSAGSSQSHHDREDHANSFMAGLLVNDMLNQTYRHDLDPAPTYAPAVEAAPLAPDYSSRYSPSSCTSGGYSSDSSSNYSSDYSSSSSSYDSSSSSDSSSCSSD